MEDMNRIKGLVVVLLIISSFQVYGQVSVDSLTAKKEYSNFEEALKEPEKVFRLNLSNQNFNMPADSVWALFRNLEYLNLRNDHLKNIPDGLGNLKKLQVLDLSGNDFRVLPQSFSKLENLTELYLNEEANMDLNQSLIVIKDLPNLRTLHLENDNLKSVPKSLSGFANLEKLYLNNNRFHKVPSEVQGLKHLNFIDLHDNKYRLDNQHLKNQVGIKVRF